MHISQNIQQQHEKSALENTEGLNKADFKCSLEFRRHHLTRCNGMFLQRKPVSNISLGQIKYKYLINNIYKKIDFELEQFIFFYF